MAYLPQVRAANTTLAFYRLLQRMLAELSEGHTTIRLPVELAERVESLPMIQLGEIAGTIVITAVDDTALVRQGINPGVEIVAIDGVPVKQYTAERVAPFYGGTHRILHYLLGGAK